MPASGTNQAGPELLLELRRGGTEPMRAQLEQELRGALRSGRLAAGARLPSSRVLARDLGVSRRLVVEAYEQLLAEGYLVSRAGAGTYVAETAAPSPSAPAPPVEKPLRFDFFPGAPDLASFPRGPWGRAIRDVLRRLPDRELGYPDARGVPAVRAELAAYLARSRGVVADPERIVVCGGVQQGLALVGGVLARSGAASIAVEDPTLPRHRDVLRHAGLEPLPVAVDRNGLVVSQLAETAAQAVLVTPAHQAAVGVALSADRRAALLEWAAGGRLVLEDDFDAEFRYDRAPIGALQGLAPERVVYLGTASKTLAPALRLGWLVAPADHVDAIVQAKILSDAGSPVIEQLAFAHMLAGGHYDRHLRHARRLYRARRDALAAAVAEHLPGARLGGVAAGLAAVLRLGRPVDDLALLRAARRRSVGVYPISWGYAEPRAEPEGLLLGYACLSEAAIVEGIRRLAEAVAEASA